MASVNLIPNAILTKRARHKRLKAWTITALVIWGLAAVPLLRELAAQLQLSSQHAEMNRLTSTLQSVSKQANDSRRRLSDLKLEIARAERLRVKRAWTAMISTVSIAMPDSVWLTTFATDPQRPRVSTGTKSPMNPRRIVAPAQERSGTPSKSGVLVGKSGPHRLVLSGKASKLEDILVFAKQLNDHNVFDDAVIRDVSEDEVEGLKVNQFRIECEW